MENFWIVAIAVLAAGLAGAVGYLAAKSSGGRPKVSVIDDDDPVGNARVEAQRILARAEEEGRARADSFRQREEAALEHRRVEVDAIETRLGHREGTLEQRAANLAQREQILIQREAETSVRQQELDRLKENARSELERIAGVDAKAAKDELLAQVEHDGRRDAMILVRDLEVKAREEADRRARRILATAIQRLASEVVTESTVSVVTLPSDDMKGRIIGREGRNIRTLEAVTGVNLIVDDTPEAVSVASFDPVRREKARITLEKLVADGRIHPASIEEAFEKAQAEVEQSVRDAGEWALLEVGLTKMHPELVTLLGQLKYRTSYGQNNLMHAREAAFICGIMATELGLDVKLAKRAALLHDIGKAISHEEEGTHPNLGGEYARKFGEHPKIVNAIMAHHGDIEWTSPEGVLVAVAEGLSAARPGARREAFESYIKRLEALETIATSFKGVDKAYAIRAGREVRVIVHQDGVSDAESAQISREMAKRVEAELTYPGQIKITVIRESRYVEYAK